MGEEGDWRTGYGGRGFVPDGETKVGEATPALMGSKKSETRSDGQPSRASDG